MSKNKIRAVVWSCEHSPFTNYEAIAAMAEAGRKFKATHAICLGDRFESAAASVHPNEYSHTLMDEYEGAARTSQLVRKLMPKASLHWMLGNHDDNITRADPRRVHPGLRGIVHWNRSEWGEEFRRWKQYPYIKNASGVLQLGLLRCYHGFNCGASSDELEALEMSYATGGRAGTLWIRGHTHRPVPITQALRTKSIPLPYHYANVGHMGPASPDWAARMNTTRWGPAYALVETDSTGWSADLTLLPQ